VTILYEQSMQLAFLSSLQEITYYVLSENLRECIFHKKFEANLQY